MMAQRSSDKRERILAAAVKVFAEKGFYSARVSDVAKEAGVADGTIYLYFESKQELLRGLFTESMTRLVEDLRRALEGSQDPIERMRLLVESYVGFAETEPALAEVLTVELRESGKFMNEFAAPLFGEFLRVIVELVEDGQAQGVFRTNLTPRIVARAMFGALDELALAWVMSTSKWNLKTSGHEVLDLFLSGILAPGTENPVQEWSRP